jgi:hypothetical protein
MTDHGPISNLPEDEQLAKYEDIAKAALRERDRILEKRGHGKPDLSSIVRSEEDYAALYDRLSPAELVQLRMEKPEEWSKLLEARRRVGERALMKWR